MPENSPSMRETLSVIPLFSGLDSACLDAVTESARVVEYARGEIIFRKGEEAKGFYCVLKGKVKLFFVSEKGAEKIVEIAGPGMTFGEAMVFINKPYPVFAQPLAATQLVFVPGASMLQGIERHPQMALRMLSGLSRRMHGLVAGMEAVCVQSSRERVIGYLLGEMDTAGSECIELPATKLAVASMLNITPETFSRILHGLEKEGVLSIQGRSVTALDAEKLRAYSAC